MHASLFWMMIVARGVAGFGAGGEYPVCGTSAAEAADETVALRKKRGILVAVATDFSIDLVCIGIFSSHGLLLIELQGFVAAGIVALIVLACFHQEVKDGVWRVSFIMGIVVSNSCPIWKRLVSDYVIFQLPLAVFVFRIRMLNSSQYRKHAIKSNFPYWLTLKRYWKPMLGTALAWFCYDFVSYPFGLFSSTIVSQFNPSNSATQNIGYGVWCLPSFSTKRLKLKSRVRLSSTASTSPAASWVAFSWTASGANRP
jgi:MFS family permease